MSYTTSAFIMLMAGLGVPVLAALNASLGKFLGSPIAAVTILLGIAFGTICIIALITSHISLFKLLEAPRHLLLAGFLMVFYILSITTIAPIFGVGNAVFFVLLGQLISASIIDHFGLFGSNMMAVSLPRLIGIGLMGLGVWMTQHF